MQPLLCYVDNVTGKRPKPFLWSLNWLVIIPLSATLCWQPTRHVAMIITELPSRQQVGSRAGRIWLE